MPELPEIETVRSVLKPHITEAYTYAAKKFDRKKK